MRDQRGQSIVEITLLTPLLLAALYVPFDFGVALYTASLAQNAVRDVARRAANKDGSDFVATTLQNEVIARTPAYVRNSATATAIRRTGGAPGCIQFVEVSVTYRYDFGFYKLARLFRLPVPDNTNVTRTSRMRYEFQPDTNGGALCTS